VKSLEYPMVLTVLFFKGIQVILSDLYFIILHVFFSFCACFVWLFLPLLRATLLLRSSILPCANCKGKPFFFLRTEKAYISPVSPLFILCVLASFSLIFEFPVRTLIRTMASYSSETPTSKNKG